MSDQRKLFVKWEQAMSLVKAEPNRVTRRLLSRVVGAIGQHLAKQDVMPSDPVDMEFLMRILQEVFSEHDRLKSVIEGRWAGEWWEDEDDS